MPKRQGDDFAGALVVKAYHRMLGQLTERELGWLTEIVLGECKWFPTIAECKEIMGRNSYANPFYRASGNSIGGPEWWNAHRIEQAGAKLELENRLKAEHAFLISQLNTEDET